MLRATLIVGLLVTSLTIAMVPSAAAQADPLSGEDPVREILDQLCDPIMGGFECCLYGMGAGFSFSYNNPLLIGEHSHCWGS